MFIFLLPILKKIAPYVKYVVLIGAIIVLAVLFVKKTKEASDLSKAMETYKRQVAGQLTTQEQQFEAANDALGLAQSKLMSQSQLLEQYKQDKIASDSALAAFQKKYNAQLQSYQLTIAQLQEQINGSKTSVVENSNPRLPTDPPPDKQWDKVIDPAMTKLAYSWSSGDGRFQLTDPDIFVAGNETFTLHQNFRVTGEIYQQKNGFLEAERLTLQEVVPDGKNTDGSPNYKVVGNANIVGSKFNYSMISPDTWVPHKGPAGVWGVVQGALGFDNGLKAHFLLGTGLDFLQFRGLYLGALVYYDTNAWKDSSFGLSLEYRPTVKGTQLNVGFGAGIATQFRQPFQSYVPTAAITFHLW